MLLQHCLGIAANKIAVLIKKKLLEQFLHFFSFRILNFYLRSCNGLSGNLENAFTWTHNWFLLQVVELLYGSNAGYLPRGWCILGNRFYHHRRWMVNNVRKYHLFPKKSRPQNASSRKQLLLNRFCYKRLALWQSLSSELGVWPLAAVNVSDV